MAGVAIEDTTVVVRALDVGTRSADQVADVDQRADSLLLETMLGRYVLDHDGKSVWLMIDGRRTVRQIADEIGEETGLSPESVSVSLTSFLAELASLGLVEIS